VVATISPQDLYRLHDSGTKLTLIDVRTPAEFGSCHVTFARNVPLEGLDAQNVIASHDTATGQPLYVICQAGSRGAQACEKLAAAGFSGAINVEGGTRAWETAGLPVIRGKKAISVDRQMRIVAGTLVLTGAVLGFFVHPYWIGLSAFVGAGLIFAGVTDCCPMVGCLARMPWNQAGATTDSCTAKR